MRIIYLALFAIATLFFSGRIQAQKNQNQLFAYWDFEVVKQSRIIDKATGLMDCVHGNFRLVKGVVGKGIKCDGFTTAITRDGDDAPEISGPFTIQAWVAPQAYPWNWCAIYNQEYNHQRGIFFGIDAEGRVGLYAAVARQWRECISDQKIPFMAWSHIAATFDPDSGIRLYINGKLSGMLNVQGDLLNDKKMDLQIARNHKRTVPSSLNRAGFVRVPASYSFDGIIDELKISKGILSEDALTAYYERTKPQGKPPLAWRKLPAIPNNNNTEFGAYYTKLKYDEDWDRLWRDDRFPDIVVTFAHKKYAMVFWKGTNYNMNLVTENGIWIGDQSAETFGDMGCMEHMSDKQNRYSHVRLIENNPARVVVHWRYALTDVLYQIANIDPVTNWGDWADEYYTIYPDGIAIRHFIVHGEEDDYSITEPTLFTNPRQKPEDNIDLAAVTLANLKGQSSTHSYETWPGDEQGCFKEAVTDPVIALLNVKANAKPFYIYEHGTHIGPYGGGIREIDYRLSRFHWRNHWPVSQIPCDGRFVLANDRVSSSAIVSAEPLLTRRKEDKALEGRFILGITDKPLEQLIPFAKFWLMPPEIRMDIDDFVYKGFDKNDRAYHFVKNGKVSKTLKFTINANALNPLVNPVFVIENWGNSRVECTLNGVRLKNPDTFKYGLQRTANSKKLVVWLEMRSEESIKMALAPKGNL